MNSEDEVLIDKVGWKWNLAFDIAFFLGRAVLWLILIPLGLYNFITRKR